jgi:hypothetical protein
MFIERGYMKKEVCRITEIQRSVIYYLNKDNKPGRKPSVVTVFKNDIVPEERVLTSTETDCGLIHCAWQVDKSIYSKVTTMVQFELHLLVLSSSYGALKDERSTANIHLTVLTSVLFHRHQQIA